MGSDSDLPVMREAAAALESFGVPYELTVASAHRSPALASGYARAARDRGLKVLVAGAGLAAHLAGALAAETILPVVGIPLASSPLGGLDSLLSTVMMPNGVPVATVAIGGAQNAAILAVQILALSDESLAEKLLERKVALASAVAEKAAALKTS
ncbi:MAG: 5-(carboxyamino)imidazole ribonucleotide mutase [Deltaproteobacteria bacterium]|jgi:phosphoribosylaminoimidazole carboxylase PurE protein|nr:5-(carboxyamino)imidazole ribonucleotide mutase [Deltaproteobacteria bacterium]